MGALVVGKILSEVIDNRKKRARESQESHEEDTPEAKRTKN